MLLVLEKEIVSTLNADSLLIDKISIKLDSASSLKELEDGNFRATFNVGSSEEKHRYMVITKEPNSLSFRIKQKTLPDEFFNFVPKSIFEEHIQEEIKFLLFTLLFSFY